MSENSTQLEKRTCSICHKEQLEDNFPDYNLANFRRGQLDGCNLCHENSKNRIFEALYRILSTENLATLIDFSKTDNLSGGDKFKREVEGDQFIEKIQHITKSIANHYFYQIRGEIEDEPDNGSADWKDEFLYTLEVYQRLHYTVQHFDRVRYGKQMERNLKYLIYSVLPREYRRKNSESEPLWTLPWISLNSLWVCYGKDPDRTDMRICSCSEDYLRNWDKWYYSSFSENYEKVRVFRNFGRLSLDWSDCYHCGGSCYYCEDEDYDGDGYVGEGDWEGIRQLCAKCNDNDLDRFDPYGELRYQETEEDLQQALPNQLMYLEHKCECGGEIESIDDMNVPEHVWRCEDCELEYKFCDTCSGYYKATSEYCPNDHFFE